MSLGSSCGLSKAPQENLANNPPSPYLDLWAQKQSFIDIYCFFSFIVDNEGPVKPLIWAKKCSVLCDAIISQNITFINSTLSPLYTNLAITILFLFIKMYFSFCTKNIINYQRTLWGNCSIVKPCFSTNLANYEIIKMLKSVLQLLIKVGSVLDFSFDINIDTDQKTFNSISIFWYRLNRLNSGGCHRKRTPSSRVG